VRAGHHPGSFALALLLNFLPWNNVALVPDFVALVLAFWCVRQPRLVGLGAGWLLGLLIDVGNGVLLGQHAARLLAARVRRRSRLSRRILWFPAVEPGACTWPRCCSSRRASRHWCGLAVRRRIPGWAIAVGPLIGAALWPVVQPCCCSCRSACRRASDETRAI
jgi:rod shape-determining protein MreD